MPAKKRKLIEDLQVECIDADKVRRRHPARRLDGWELKIFATLHSRFEELLFLDADCYPCRHPEFLFEEKAYKKAGAIFWPDCMTNDSRLKWAAFGVADPKRIGSIESGQYVLNKRLSWTALNLAWFYNDHSDYYYRYCYGDKHTLEVAWHRVGQRYVKFTPTARMEPAGYLHVGPDHEPLFIHRCTDKFRLNSQEYPTPQRAGLPGFDASLPLEVECWSWLRELGDAIGTPIRSVNGAAPKSPRASKSVESMPLSAGTPVAEWVRLITSANRKAPQGWHAWPSVQEAHRIVAKQFVAALAEYPHDAYQGRGIVIAGGGRYFASTYVTIRVIRHVGCTLPIQVWSLADEIDARQKSILEALPGVVCVEAPGIAHGWQLKSHAVLNSPWREVLYLDADSYPVTNPDYLFSWGRYVEEGAIFFPDLPSWKLGDDAWRLFGLEPIQERAWESGQFIVDKESCWRELNLADWFNQHADYYYQHTTLGLHGDKDLFHFAWRCLGRTFYHPWGGDTQWQLHTILQRDWDGNVIFQHRVRDKFFLADESFSTTPQTFRGEGKNRYTRRLAHEDFCFRALEELRAIHATPKLEAVILTCPGRERLLAKTLKSLKATDWKAKPIIVVDQSEHPDRRERQIITCRRLLAEALQRPWDYLLFLEDDVVFNRHLRHNLIRWKRLNGVHLASLYRPQHVLGYQTEFNADVADPQTVYGSQAFLLSRKSVQYILDHYDEGEGMQDIRFSRLAARLGPIYYHAPSLVQHVGKVSMWTGNDSRFHQAIDFDEEWRA
jgi:hypothetical protein